MNVLSEVNDTSQHGNHQDFIDCGSWFEPVPTAVQYLPVFGKRLRLLLLRQRLSLPLC